MNSCYCISRLWQHTVEKEVTKRIQPSTRKLNSSYVLSSTFLIPNRYFSSTLESNQVSNPNRFSYSNSAYESHAARSTRNNHFVPSALFGVPKIYQGNLYEPASSYTQYRSFSNEVEKMKINLKKHLNEVKQEASQSAETLNDGLVIPSLDLTENVLSTSNIEELANVVEPSFQSLGLAHWWPSGFMQAFMEYMYLNLDINWSGTIILTTVILRVCTLPLVIKAKKVAVKSNHNLPESQRLQAMMSGATTKSERIKALNDLRNFQIEKGINPVAQFSPLIANGMILTTMFCAIRGMANCPVESMKAGGMGWFTDLTISDPMYILPLLTSSTLFLNMKWGVDSGEDMPGVSPDVMKMMPYITYGLPIIMLPVMIQFPAALNVYWFTTNVISCFQGALLRNKTLSRSVGIEEFKKWKSEDLTPQVGFMDQMRRTMEQAENERKEGKTRQSFKLDDIIKTPKVKTKNK